MSDLISREDAIKAVKDIVDTMSVCLNVDECHGMRRMKDRVIDELKNLPPAKEE